MKRLIPLLLALVLLTAGAPSAQDADKLFKTAMNTELVDGDLQGAIEQYQQVVKTGSRAVAAQALVRMAECYQKLGDTQSRTIYERLVRDYADQKEAAAVARARLGVERKSTDKTTALRKVWRNPMVSTEECGLSADGRYITCPAWETGDLMLHDLMTGTDRLLTTNNWAGDQYAQGSAISKDGAHVAYAWFNGKDHYELRVRALQGADVQPRVLLNNEDIDYIVPSDWTPNGEFVVVRIFRKDRTAQIGLVAVKNGALRILKTTEWSGAKGLFLSPDGKYVGFDLISGSGEDERDVFVLAIDGSRETAAVVHPGRDVMMGWSPDGRQLLFGSDRGGTPGLWSVPMASGQAAGTATLIKPDIAPASLGITGSGALFVVAQVGIIDVYSADLNLEASRLSSAPTSVVRTFIGRNRLPVWSRDGKDLAYVSHRLGNERAIVIRSLETGETREVNVAMRYFGPMEWSPDKRSFLVKGQNLKAEAGIYEIDARTGQPRRLPFEVGPCAGDPQWSPDGKKVYFFGGTACPGREGAVLIEGDPTSGSVREVLHGVRLNNNIAVSPNGHFIAGTTTVRASKDVSVVIAPVAGGQAREVHHLTNGQSVSNWGVSWLPDGQHLVLTLRDTRAKKNEVLIVSIDGPHSRRVDGNIPYPIAGGVRVHPDGRQVAFSAGEYDAEVWVLENFLPESGALRSAAK